jgi:hypothetical protein
MKTETCIVILGLDADKKPRAAKFPEADEKAVTRAAAAQGLKIGRPKSDEAMELALRLVDGKIFQSGKGLLPLVNAQTYEQLLKLLAIEEPKVEAPAAKTTPAPSKPAAAPSVGDPWTRIAVGASVLSRDNSKGGGGWWPCKVVGASTDGKLITVRWDGFKDIPQFTVKRTAVAILPIKA